VSWISPESCITAIYYNTLADYGPVQKGRIADLVLLRANPLVDIRNTREISAVIADGRYMSQADIDLLRQRLKQLAAAR
jgi:imidazolonepropionase-like amidohydrolase